jgi:hypothetical protein
MCSRITGIRYVRWFGITIKEKERHVATFKERTVIYFLHILVCLVAPKPTYMKPVISAALRAPFL